MTPPKIPLEARPDTAKVRGMARIAIVGVGAIGSVIASLLEEAGHEVLLCVRRPLPELVVERASGSVRVSARRLLNPGEATPVDWVLVATKAYDVPAAAAWLGPLASRGCPVAVLQNGVEHRERFAAYIPSERIVPVVVDCPVERPRPSTVRQRGVMHLKVADDEKGRAFVQLFAGTQADASATGDFKSAVWLKLCKNSAGVVNALVLQPNRVFANDAVAENARQIIGECIAVARAEGAVLDDSLADTLIAGYRAAPPDGVNSLQADQAAGRPTEIDARNGAIVRFGKRHGIPTPCNQMAVALLGAMSR
jgi:2-dehydropantoate 2-reductase